MAHPQACPDESTLWDFLQDQLIGTDTERVDDHIGGCPACQRALDRLVGSLPGRWLKDTGAVAGDAPLMHAASASLGVMPQVLESAIEPGGTAGPMSRPVSPGMPSAADGPARLHLFGEIARGGMGAILKGRDVALGRDLAVKVLLDRHRDNARADPKVRQGGADRGPAPAPRDGPRPRTRGPPRRPALLRHEAGQGADPGGSPEGADRSVGEPAAVPGVLRADLPDGGLRPRPGHHPPRPEAG